MNHSEKLLLCLRFERITFKPDVTDEELSFWEDHQKTCPLGIHTVAALERQQGLPQGTLQNWNGLDPLPSASAKTREEYYARRWQVLGEENEQARVQDRDHVSILPGMIRQGTIPAPTRKHGKKKKPRQIPPEWKLRMAASTSKGTNSEPLDIIGSFITGEGTFELLEDLEAGGLILVRGPIPDLATHLRFGDDVYPLKHDKDGGYLVVEGVGALMIAQFFKRQNEEPTECAVRFIRIPQSDAEIKPSK